MDPASEGVILFDIGGGSSEIVRLGRSRPATGGPPAPQIVGWASLPLGVVSLAERYGGVTVDANIYQSMVAEVEAHVRRFAAEHGGGLDLGCAHLLGTSGTVTTILSVRRVRNCFDAAFGVKLRSSTTAITRRRVSAAPSPGWTKRSSTLRSSSRWVSVG